MTALLKVSFFILGAHHRISTNSSPLGGFDCFHGPERFILSRRILRDVTRSERRRQRSYGLAKGKPCLPLTRRPMTAQKATDEDLAARMTASCCRRELVEFHRYLSECHHIVSLGWGRQDSWCSSCCKHKLGQLERYQRQKNAMQWPVRLPISLNLL
ncbi:hypothetical protein C8J56DRAFT_252950 [Mycena floridula]|nr:hypothetical protein C8J56DRAFT_252950 [Mycena floridula]